MIFLAKKEEFIPADLVKRLYTEGKGETQIITQLRAQGFTPSQIDKALKAVPKPTHTAPKPVEAAMPRKEEPYRGPLPKEIVRPTAHAEAPMHSTFTPLESSNVGETPEKIDIPEELRPMDITPVSHSAKPPAKPTHGEAPTPMKQEPMQSAAAQHADSAATPRISLEELIEQIAAEQEKRMQSRIAKLQSENEANGKTVSEMSAKVQSLYTDFKALQKAVDDKSAFSSDANKEVAVKVDALETAFKELAHFLHKK